MKNTPSTPKTRITVHSWSVRVTHWVNVLAILVMMLSGWRIYNISPLLPFHFPESLTLGGRLADALQWHFAMMWVLVINNTAYLLIGFASGHFSKKLLPVPGAELRQDLKRATTFKLTHKPGRYNSIQRAAYISVILVVVLIVASGFAIWKPIQLQEVAWLMGGYEGARMVHFGAMFLALAFVFVHLVMVLVVPRSLIPMITGKAKISERAAPLPRHADFPSTEAGDAL